MTLGIFGGTFDPIHTGHLIVARAALEVLGLDEVLFVPAGRPWMKAREDVSPAEDRARMAELAVAGDPQFRVSRMEIERAGETYTVDTLRALPAGDGRPVLLLGADAFAGFPAWREPAEIARLARIAVLGRPGRDTAAIIDEVEAEVANVDAAPLEAPLIEISATAIRDRVRRRLPIRDLVPPAVADYIADRGLSPRVDSGRVPPTYASGSRSRALRRSWRGCTPVGGARASFQSSTAGPADPEQRFHFQRPRETAGHAGRQRATTKF